MSIVYIKLGARITSMKIKQKDIVTMELTSLGICPLISLLL